MIDAAERCSAGRWLTLAQGEISSARAAGRLPILVGGTGLYLEALLHGLAELPAIPAACREAARALHAELGGAAFRAALAAIDPETAARLAPGDTQRLTRAYEVAIATGRPSSDWQRRPVPTPLLRAAALVLLPPRDALYAACDARLLRMMAGGGEAEARALIGRGLAPILPAMKAVGVREVQALLAGKMSREATVAAMQRATRQYAKRQYTWFRHRPREAPSVRKRVLEAQFSESLLPEIFSFIRPYSVDRVALAH